MGPAKMRDGWDAFWFLFAHLFTTCALSWAQFECFQYRDHPADSSMYQMKEQGKWQNFPCRAGTLWDGRYCHCKSDPIQDEVPIVNRCEKFRPVANDTGKYEEFVEKEWTSKDCRDIDPKLAWNQTTCQCVWIPETSSGIIVDPESTACTMFDTCFDENPPKDKRGSSINMVDPMRVWLVEDPDAYTRKAIKLNGAPLFVDLFKQNYLSDSFQIYFRFKLEETDDPELREKYQVILSNKCKNNSATISISYKAEDYTYRVLFDSSQQPNLVLKECSYEAGDRFSSWKSVYILYQEGLVVMAVNGKPCLQFPFKGWPNFVCPLFIGGNPSSEGPHSDETYFHGYLDVMTVERSCQPPMP